MQAPVGLCEIKTKDQAPGAPAADTCHSCPPPPLPSLGLAIPTPTHLGTARGIRRAAWILFEPASGPPGRWGEGKGCASQPWSRWALTNFRWRVGRGGYTARRCAAGQSSRLGLSLTYRARESLTQSWRRCSVDTSSPTDGTEIDQRGRRALKRGHGPGDPPVGGSNFPARGSRVASSFKLFKSGAPFLFHPSDKCVLVPPSWVGCLGVRETKSAGSWTCPLHRVDIRVGLQSGKNRGVLSIPGPYGMFRGSHGPRGSRWPARGRGGRGRDPRESGDPVRSALRFRPGTALSAPGVCACAGAAAERGGGGRDPLPAPPRAAPSPTPLTRLGCLAPLRAPHCRLQFRLQLGFPLWLRSRSRSGSRSDAAALWLGRRGGRSFPPRPARRAGAGRGGARPSRPGARDPRPRRRRRQRLPGAGPALPCRSPARPSAGPSQPPTPRPPAPAARRRDSGASTAPGRRPGHS